MKWVTPASSCCSSRDPAPIQNPTAAERTWPSGSEITRSPESSSVSLQFCTVGILGVAASNRLLQTSSGPARHRVHACNRLLRAPRIRREQRPDDCVLPLAVQPDRLSLDALALEA